MSLSLINFSFLISTALLALGQLIIPTLNTHYCLEKQRKLIEKAELTVLKNASRPSLIISKLNEISEIKSINEVKNGYFNEFHLELNYSDLLKQTHSFKYSINKPKDNY